MDNRFSSTFVVQAPFNDRSIADIVLRSSDDVDFFVSKSTLAVASPIFCDMLKLGRSSSSSSGASWDSETKAPSTDATWDDEMKEGLPVVPMCESPAPVLDALLRILYPLKSPTLDNFNTISGIAFTAHKYEMEYVAHFVEETLVKKVESGQPAGIMQVYILACIHGLNTLARQSARVLLKHPVQETYSPALKDAVVSANAMWREWLY